MYVLCQDSNNILAAKYEKIGRNQTPCLIFPRVSPNLSFKKKKIYLFFGMTQIDWIKRIFPKLMIGNQNNDTSAG